MVRLSGQSGVSVEDYLPYKGESKWIELDSNPITFYMADHQDQFDSLEILMVSYKKDLTKLAETIFF
jgi:hypothetical protein